MAVTLEMSGNVPTSTDRRPNWHCDGLADTFCSHLAYAKLTSVSCPPRPPADARYAAIRAALDAAGTPIAPNGLLIAAHAVAADVTLVTADVGAFERVEGLRIENLLA